MGDWVNTLEHCGDVTILTEVPFQYGGGILWMEMGAVGQLGVGKDDGCLIPTLIDGRQLFGRSVFRVSDRGQHTVIRDADKNNSVDYC